VIWSPDEPFSVGADLQAMLPVFMGRRREGDRPGSGQVPAGDDAAEVFAGAVVAAVSGMALGAAARRCCTARAGWRTWRATIGLVEVGVGLIPAGGGLKEGALRAAQAAAGGGADRRLPLRQELVS